MKLGVIEAGGTKIIVGIGDEHGTLHEVEFFPTKGPEETVEKIGQYFADKTIDALGIGTFGPADLNPESETYGYILDTPKPGWSMFPLLDRIKEYVDVPTVFDTDVNGAALGEMMWGAAKGLDSCLYMTIGTGVGGGFCHKGELLHGMMHPEMGHLLLRRHPEDDYKGHCPFHGDCFEGMACGPAIEDRWNQKAYDLPIDHQAWEMEAYYIAQALMQYVLVLSPEKIILGGGVMKQKQLFEKVHVYLKSMMKAYIKNPLLGKAIDKYIVYPALGDNSGTYGALALAIKALGRSEV